MKMQEAILAKEYTAELIQFFWTALLITYMNIFTHKLNSLWAVEKVLSHLKHKKNTTIWMILL